MRVVGPREGPGLRPIRPAGVTTSFSQTLRTLRDGDAAAAQDADRDAAAVARRGALHRPVVRRRRDDAAVHGRTNVSSRGIGHGRVH